jgi:hypothetical protein
VLACLKCQKRLRKNEKLEALAHLKKTVKRHNKRAGANSPLHERFLYEAVSKGWSHHLHGRDFTRSLEHSSQRE